MSDALTCALIAVGLVGGSIVAGLLHLHLRKRKQERGALEFINFVRNINTTKEN